MEPLRLPVAAAWNVNATMEGETREHEAAHAVAAHLVGFEVAAIEMDAKWADYGHLGRVSCRWHGTAHTEELAFARAIVAAAGPVVTDSWGLDSSRGDRAKVEEVRWPTWSPDAWAFVVVHKTERLVRSEPFRRLHRRVVAALDEVGDTGTLSGDALAQSMTRERRLLSGGTAPPTTASVALGSRIGRCRRTRMESPGARPAWALRLR